jgi:hypothetical protein
MKIFCLMSRNFYYSNLNLNFAPATLFPYFRMKTLQIATIFALLVSVAISDNVQPTEMLAQRIHSRGVKILAQRIPKAGLKMLGIECSNCLKSMRNDKKRNTVMNKITPKKDYKYIKHLNLEDTGLSNQTSRLQSP